MVGGHGPFRGLEAPLALPESIRTIDRTRNQHLVGIATSPTS